MALELKNHNLAQQMPPFLLYLSHVIIYWIQCFLLVVLFFVVFFN